MPLASLFAAATYGTPLAAELLGRPPAEVKWAARRVEPYIAADGSPRWSVRLSGSSWPASGAGSGRCASPGSWWQRRTLQRVSSLHRIPMSVCQRGILPSCRYTRAGGDAVPKVTIYLPDPLAEEVKAADLPVSTICQEALTAALARRRVHLNPEDLDAVVQRLHASHALYTSEEFSRGMRDGAWWAREFADRDELEKLAALEQDGQLGDVWRAFDVSDGWWTLHDFLSGGHTPEDDTHELRREVPYHEGFVRGAWQVWDRVRLRLVDPGDADAAQ